ncbi:hypothetical protein DKX38_027128 [Salix brachista]|uniref:Uncharacterized protein n=1 Tax=Salix brachista TaxID=2182728 RepID=A0A5N5JFB5_9ROSI|nr:hypothetical protein DKX38_027128 [Salix brachista]
MTQTAATECPPLDRASSLSFDGVIVVDSSVREQRSLKGLGVENFEKEQEMREGIVGRRREKSVMVVMEGTLAKKPLEACCYLRRKLKSLMESENQMKIMYVCHVTPAFESATEFSLPLTFFDIIWLKFPPVERIFFYKLTELSPSFFNSVILPNLKHSLSHALLHFLPLAGNLTWPPQATKPILLYTPNDGVELTVAESNADFHHLSGNGVREALESRLCIPELPVTDSKASVIALKITLFPKQGFCIGISSHHGIMDGKSSTMFIKAWAHICKLSGREKQQHPDLLPELTPFFDRTDIQDPEGLEMVYLNNWLEHKWPGSDPNPRSMKLLPALAVPVRATFELSGEDIKKLRTRLSQKGWKVAEWFLWHLQQIAEPV